MNNESKKDALQEKLMIGKTDGLLGAEKETAEKIGPVLFDLAMDEEKGDGYGSVFGLADAILDERMPFLACVKYVSDKYMDFRNYLEGKNTDRFLAQAALQFYYEDPKDSLCGSHDKETAAFYKEKRKGFNPAMKTYADYVETAVARGDIAREKAMNEKFSLHKCFTYVTDRLTKDEDSKDGSITPPSNRSVFFYVRKFFALTEEELDALYPKKQATKDLTKSRKKPGKKKAQPDTVVPVAVDEECPGDISADIKKDAFSETLSDMPEKPAGHDMTDNEDELVETTSKEQTSGEAARPEEKDPAEIPSGDGVPETEEPVTSADLAGEAAECGESSKAEDAKTVNKRSSASDKKNAEEKPKKNKKKKKSASCDGQLSFEDFFGF